MGGKMATLTVRKLPEQVIANLKALARRHNRSMEQEAREILKAAAADRLLACEIIEQGWKKVGRPVDKETIVRWVREDRER